MFQLITGQLVGPILLLKQKKNFKTGNLINLTKTLFSSFYKVNLISNNMWHVGLDFNILLYLQFSLKANSSTNSCPLRFVIPFKQYKRHLQNHKRAKNFFFLMERYESSIHLTEMENKHHRESYEMWTDSLLKLLSHSDYFSTK